MFDIRDLVIVSLVCIILLLLFNQNQKINLKKDVLA